MSELTEAQKADIEQQRDVFKSMIDQDLKNKGGPFLDDAFRKSHLDAIMERTSFLPRI